MSERFSDPKLAINRVYTKKGDQGQTSLVGGERVGKGELRIAAYGTIDELNAFFGAAIVTLKELNLNELNSLNAIFLRIQHELFNLGSILATRPDKIHPSQPRVRDEEIKRLEEDIDHLNQGLPQLRSFVLPGGSRLSAELHQCRTICRRAERICVSLSLSEDLEKETLIYLNRLSDAFFVFSRYVDFAQGKDEILWDPNIGKNK